jgi:hypothetical protein
MAVSERTPRLSGEEMDVTGTDECRILSNRLPVLGRATMARKINYYSNWTISRRTPNTIYIMISDD